MEFKDLKDGLLYPLTDFKMILLLGFVLFLAELVNEVHGTSKFSLILKLILTLVALMMSVVEAGYLFRVVEETIKGSDSLPQFQNIKSVFMHGTKEIVVTIVFLFFPMLEIVISSYFFSSGQISHDVMDLNLGYIFLIIGFISSLVVGFILQGVIINMAQNSGTLRSAFEFKKIQKIMGKVGYKNLLLTYLIAFLTFGSLILFFADTIKNIPFVGLVILLVFIEPYLLLFNIRVLGLIGRQNREVAFKD